MTPTTSSSGTGVPAKILLIIFLFIVLVVVAAILVYAAYNKKEAKEVENEPRDKKEHAAEGDEEALPDS